MDNSNGGEIPLYLSPEGTLVLEGSLREYSTENLHYHSCHQLLRIRSGITLLVDGERKQPLFSNMTALIPAGAAHRSLVLGEAVRYKSVYLDRELLSPKGEGILIFDMSELGAALFDRLGRGAGDEGIDRKCLDLLLCLMEEEMGRPSSLARLPLPRREENVRVISFMEENFPKKLKLSDFAGILNYSERHSSRIFKEDLGISLFEYLKLYRIFQASLRLGSGKNRSITEIAFSCGYDSLSSFYKDFKEVFSLTPKEFRLRKG
ncbi:MAG: AraC family transcriptional regulator [Spirochaetales bacterium]|nr:AraC family transcriptional regulator [Spirochaetales bacterium]